MSVLFKRLTKKLWKKYIYLDYTNVYIYFSSLKKYALYKPVDQQLWDKKLK